MINVQWPVNAEDITSTESYTSPWFNKPTGRGFHIFTKYGGAGTATVTVDISAAKANMNGADAKAPADFAETGIAVVTLVDAGTGAWVDPPEELDRPIASYRIKVAASVADLTGMYVGVGTIPADV
jgi:hypothetical protein